MFLKLNPIFKFKHVCSDGCLDERVGKAERQGRGQEAVGVFIKAKQREGDDEVEEQQVLKEARKESSRMAQIQRDFDSSALSEATVRLVMDRFVPW
ncbi:unnamed protein product [Prunus armeniaca]|uniref:Uncharacterized protein n=1 Tax=Prunus armeniaca TaxID=36596 RepID=A0A6J5VST8_PRUAR|nr:unnamed protein product [Prunus armeniaca]